MPPVLVLEPQRGIAALRFGELRELDVVRFSVTDGMDPGGVRAAAFRMSWGGRRCAAGCAG